MSTERNTGSAETKIASTDVAHPPTAVPVGKVSIHDRINSSSENFPYWKEYGEIITQSVQITSEQWAIRINSPRD